MPVITGISKAWRTARLAALQANTLRVAMYYASANLDPQTVTVYTTTDEIVGAGYTAGGFPLTTTLNSAGTIPYLDIDDVFISGLTVTNLGGLMIYDVTDANAVLALIQLSPRSYLNRDVQIIWPTPNINSAVIRCTG